MFGYFFIVAYNFFRKRESEGSAKFAAVVSLMTFQAFLAGIIFLIFKLSLNLDFKYNVSINKMALIPVCAIWIVLIYSFYTPKKISLLSQAFLLKAEKTKVFWIWASLCLFTLTFVIFFILAGVATKK